MSDNYSIGKGIVYFNKKVNGVYEGERDLGNCPEFSYSIPVEELDHYSSRGGLKTKDKKIISQVSPAVSFTLDELTPDNVALLTLSDIEEITQVAATITGETKPGYKGKRIILENRNIDPATVVVKEGATTLVLDTDYTIDLIKKDDKIGRILILETATITADGVDLIIDYDTLGATYKKLKGVAQTIIEGSLRFVSDNPVGNQQELLIHKASITPAGDTAMIGDDWSTLGFAGEILKDEVDHPNSPYFDIYM